MISAGTHHTCGVNDRGETWCWGRNQYGELGTDGGENHTPVQARISDLVEVVSGTQATCGRKEDGTLWCWGRILSDDEDTLRSPPQLMSMIGGEVQQFDMAERTAFVLKKDGSITLHFQGSTQQIVATGAGPLSVYYEEAVCFVRGDGTLGCQGYNDNGILGNGTTRSGATQVKVPDGTTFQQVSLGGHFACGLTTAGEVWCWGSNERAQTGTRQSSQTCQWSAAGAVPCNPTPVKVSGLPAPAKAIATGYDFALALLTDGTVWGWGSATQLHLGTPSSETCTSVFGTSACSPTPLKAPVERLVSLSAGASHACGCDQDGTAWCWGSTGSGKLGIPPTTSESPPIQVQGFRCW
jgi:alpha-tubulin suppressor-like RCC1 family protein